MASAAPTVVLPSYSDRAAHPRSRLSYVVVTLLLALLGAFYGLMIVFLPMQLLTIPLAPIGIMLLIVLWLLPDVDRVNTPRLTRAFFIFAAVYMLWPTYIALDVPGLPWINLQRLALIWLMLWFIIEISTSSKLRTEVLDTARYSKLFFWSFLTFFATQIYTLVLSPQFLWSAQRVVLNAFTWTAMFFVACHIFLRPGVALRAVRYMTVAVIFIGLIAVWENQRQSVPWVNSIPWFLHVDESLLSLTLSSQARAQDGLYRVRSVFSMPLIFAEFLSMALPLIIHQIVESRSRVARALALLAYVLASAGILFSHSRLGAVGWFQSHLMYLSIWSLRRFFTRKSDLVSAIFGYGFPVVIVAFLVLLMSSHTLYVSVLGGSGATASSNEARYIQRDMAIPKILANPIGYGSGESGQVLGYVGASGVISIDSYVIGILLEYGVIGFLSYFTMILTAAFIGIQYYFRVDDEELSLLAPLGIALSNYVVIRWVLALEYNQSLMYIYLGMVAALATRAAQVYKAKSKVPVMVAPGWGAKAA